MRRFQLLFREWILRQTSKQFINITILSSIFIFHLPYHLPNHRSPKVLIELISFLESSKSKVLEFTQLYILRVSISGNHENQYVFSISFNPPVLFTSQCISWQPLRAVHQTVWTGLHRCRAPQREA